MFRGVEHPEIVFDPRISSPVFIDITYCYMYILTGLIMNYGVEGAIKNHELSTKYTDNLHFSKVLMAFWVLYRSRSHPCYFGVKWLGHKKKYRTNNDTQTKS